MAFGSNQMRNLGTGEVKVLNAVSIHSSCKEKFSAVLEMEEPTEAAVKVSTAIETAGEVGSSNS